MILRRRAPRRPERSRIARMCVLALALLVGLPSRPLAHEVPTRVALRLFVKPDGAAHLLRVVVRVPVEAMRDVELPLHGPGYLDIARAEPLLRDAAVTWIVNYLELYEGNRRLTGGRVEAARVSLPSDRSFGSYETALAHIADSALTVTDLVWKQAMLDVVVTYPITSDQSRFSIHPGLAHLGLRTSTVLHFVTPDGTVRALQYDGDPGVVRLDPRWHQAAAGFVRAGFLHILGGIDHLLFVLCLVIPFRRLRPLVAIVTAFTVAHSITLIASALGIAPDAGWFPPLIETLIAASVVYMALENVLARPSIRRRWMMAFAFGLVHGFGFSFVLRDSLQFAGSHLALSLVSFNVGVEIGQLVVLAAAVPVLALAYTRMSDPRALTIVLSALVAHTAWHWMLDRGAVVRQYRVQWPSWDAAFLASGMRGVMLLAIIGGCAWALTGVMGRLARPSRGGEVGAD